MSANNAISATDTLFGLCDDWYLGSELEGCVKDLG
jgi:hypothetical protein